MTETAQLPRLDTRELSTNTDRISATTLVARSTTLHYIFNSFMFNNLSVLINLINDKVQKGSTHSQLEPTVLVMDPSPPCSTPGFAVFSQHLQVFSENSSTRPSCKLIYRVFVYPSGDQGPTLLLSTLLSTLQFIQYSVVKW